MTAEARRAAKQQLLTDLQGGCAVQETRARANIPWHPATIYRLQQRLQGDPALALADGRHGHPAKLRGEVRDWLVRFCQAAPYTPSRPLDLGTKRSSDAAQRSRPTSGTDQQFTSCLTTQALPATVA